MNVLKRGFFPQGMVAAMALTMLLTTGGPAAAQSGGEQYRHFTIRDGLSNTFIWMMMQDRHGFIWTAGNAGLEKFDGQNFTTYRNDPQNPNSVPGGQMRTILEAHDGMLWIGSGQGLAIFDPALEKSKTVHVADSLERLRFLWTLHQDGNGDIWAGTADGLFHIPVQDYSADTLRANFFLFNVEQTTAGTIRSIVPRGDDAFWVGTNSGLYVFDRNSHEFSSTGPFDGELQMVQSATIWYLLADRNDNLWISTDNGLALWRSGADTPELVKSFANSDLDLSGAYLQGLFGDEDGMIYISTDAYGALLLNPESMEVTVFEHIPGNANSLQATDVHYFFRDRDGNFWFGYHFQGISLMYRDLWNYSYSLVVDTAPPIDPANQVRTLWEDSRGNLWFGTNHSAVMKPADGSAHKIFTPDVAPDTDNPRASWIFGFHDDGDVMYFYNDQHLYAADIRSGTLTRIDLPGTENILISNSWDDRHIYLGTVSSGLLVIDKSDHSVTVITSLDNDSESDEIPLIDLYRDAAGNLWIYEMKPYVTPFTWKIYAFDPDTRRFADTGHPFVADINNVTPPAPSQTEPGVFWIATDKGLLRQDIINGENQIFLADEPSVTTLTFYRVLPDKEGFVWIGGAGSILRFDPVTGNTVSFDPDVNRRPQALLWPIQMSNHDIVFGGFGGYIRFNPDELLEEAPIAFINLTEMRAGAEIIPLLYDNRRANTFEHSSNNLTFSFSAINYKSPASTRYRYRLNGYQDEWVEIGMQTQVFLANLSPGSYEFQVQARNRNGTYSDAVAGVLFTIRPPWWRTVPAYFGYLLIIAGLVFTVDRFQRRRLLALARERSREKELEHAREIQKAYDNLKAAQEQLIQQEKLASLGQLTAGIAHEIKNPLNFVNNFSEVSLEMIDEVVEEIDKMPAGEEASVMKQTLADIKSNLTKIHEHGSRADGIVKSMLLHSRGGSGEKIPTNLNALVQEYTNLAYHGMRAGKHPINVDIALETDEAAGEVPLVTEDFSRVILNLCNNAFDAMRDKLETVNANGVENEQGNGNSNGSGNGNANGNDGYNPRLTVRTLRKADNVNIEIEDNGPGIPDEIKDKILQPFFTTKKGTQGTGLGLSITHDIIKAHGGKLEIESKTGKTIFKIMLEK